MNVCQYPIAVMSFNRPDLLTEVLKSLKSQTIGIDESRIYLFQDGAQSRFTQAHADASLQEECVKRFREIFPNGKALPSPVNLGIALNFDRAERVFFEELRAECGLFFEDDLVLSPYYLEALLQLVDFALAEPLVGYVAAYGDHRASKAKQQAWATKIIPMNHSWGFALTRRQWSQQRGFVDGYLSIVRDDEYARRDPKRIAAYFAQFGLAFDGCSQDVAKTIACLVLGTTRLMCFPCYGRYIGEKGAHFTPEIYAQHCYDKTTLYDQRPIRFSPPTKTQLLTWIDVERQYCRQKLAGLPRTSQPIDLSIQISALEFIQGLYNSLLGRAGDEKGLEAWITAIRTGHSLSDIAEAFVRSQEFMRRYRASLD
jgi:Domain of unknown function (DUF4214)/Glycosyl transferase family 2